MADTNTWTGIVNEMLKDKIKIKRICRQLQRAIDHTKNKIDELVYELYGLTEEEIEIVENG